MEEFVIYLTFGLVVAAGSIVNAALIIGQLRLLRARHEQLMANIVFIRERLKDLQ